MAIRVITCAGAAVTPYLDDLARLRMVVFRDYPYLYVGDVGYERDYLATYAASARSVFVLAIDDDAVVGVSSGIPLAEDGEAFQQPFRERGMAIDEVFYFGESVLLKTHRGQGIGHRFFDEREAHARRLGGFRWTSFCAVERTTDDPRRPLDYRPNDVFWHKRGYQRQPAMFCQLHWKEAADAQPMSHQLRFWLRPLDPANGRLEG
jgi:GNAT superfamily N-acetyltransferase